MLPATPGGIGIYEFCCVLVLHNLLGYTNEIAAIFGLTSHFFAYVYLLIAGFIILTIENLKFSDLQKDLAESKQ